MKKLIVLAAFFSLAGAAHAQRAMANPSAGVSTSGSSGGGGGLSSPPHSSINSLPGPYSGPRANVSATNSGEFVPTIFESYQEALIWGERELEARPLQVAEAARMTQAMKKSGTQKPALIADQDSEGNLVISAGDKE